MVESNIIIIDGNKFYWDIKNECLIPYELIDKKINTPEYHTHSVDLYEQTINNSNNSNNTNNDNIDWEWYMEHYDIDFWEGILSRELDNDERKLIHGVWNENSLNLDIKMLQKSIIQNNCYIKSITTNVGNCLFESIGSLGLGDNDLGIEPCKMIRKNLAAILLSVKTEIGFFPNFPNSTPEEIWKTQNEIGFVKDNMTKSVYIYDYDMMLYDLKTNYSWTRLPMEFLLMAISRIYQVEILILHNKTNYVHKINIWNHDVQTIRLGLINEEHYFPLLKLTDELANNPDVIKEILETEIKYDKYILQFKKWSKIMMDSIKPIQKNKTIKTNDNIKTNDKIEIIQTNEINTTISTNSSDSIIMKTKKILTPEQIYDYQEISNLDDFCFI